MRRVLVILLGLVVVGGLVVLIISLIGRSHKKGPTVITLKVWSPFNEKKAYQDLAQSFLDAHANTKFEFTFVDTKDAQEYQTKVSDALAAGNGPDIWLLRNDWLPTYQTKLAQLPSSLTFGSINKQGQDDGLIKLLGQTLIDQNSIGGKLYALPLAVDSLALFINTKVLGDAQSNAENSPSDSSTLSSYPTSWDELAKWSQLMTKKSGSTITRSGLALGTSQNSYAATDAYLALLNEVGGSLYSSDGKTVSFHSPKTTAGVTTNPAEDALKFFSSFARKDDPNYTWNSSMGDPIDAFVNGKLGMMFGYSSLKYDFLTRDKNFTLANVMPLPQPKSLIKPTDQRFDYAIYWTHGVSAQSPNQLLAWQFLKSFTTQEQLQTYAKATGRLTINQLTQDPLNSNTTTDFNDGSIFLGQIQTSTVAYKPNWQGVDQALQDMINSASMSGQNQVAIIDTVAAKLKDVVKQ